MKSSVLRELRSPVVALAVLSARVFAAQSPDCEGVIARGNLVACAEANSPLLAEEQAAFRAGEGRREAARPFLPSNPSVSGSVASRSGPDARAVNWYLTLSQELEIGGQSGLRVDAADRELSALNHQVSVARAEVAQQVWLAYFELLSARQRVILATQVDKAIAEVAATVRAMATAGLAGTVEATVADAAAVKSGREVLQAERSTLAAELRLRSLLGASSRPAISGELEPLRWQGAPQTQRPEAAALKAMREALSRRVVLLRRANVPNPTVSLFAQNDGFNEQVLGVGLSLPIPLPQPLGRTRAGEIAEAVAFEEKQGAALQQLERALSAELALARADADTGTQILALYSPARITDAMQGLTAIASQLRAARLPVREALSSQQSLVEFLNAEVEARHALCVASVRLVRASGGSLEGGDL